jgi:iron(III) transport system substrate-binding protein
MELSILGSYHEDMVKRLAEMFEAETGCKVSYLRMPTGEAVAKLTAEKDNPSVSVFLGGTVDGHENLKQQGILTAYTSPVESELPSEYVDPDGVWKAQYVETLSIGVNTERWEKEFASTGLEIPTTLEELLNPAFKGEIITPDPSTSGTGYCFVSSVLQYMGEEEGWKYLEAFNDQVGQYTSSGYTPAEKTGLGEYLISVNFLADQLIVKTSGYPMQSTVYEGAGWSMVPVSMVAGSEDNPAAQQFIDFCLTKEALDALVELANCVAVRDDAIAPEGGSKLSELNFNREFDPIAAAEVKAETLEKFSAIQQ